MLIKRAVLARLCAEIGILVLLATIIGLGCNYRLLKTVWFAAKTSTVPVQTVPQMSIPLPLGLMQVKELFDKKGAVIIDARDRNAYAAGHIKGAISLPLMEASSLVPELSGRVPKEAVLVVYCNGYACEDSVDLGKQLLSAGYVTVYYFDGGFPAWLDARYPVGKGAKPGVR